ncbi:unnamed protein product [Cylindrotheca closterium]|uniref:Uncharacterized protein n=1 Tax=Cylindrotheca closterium TaxID=2856 RepID=A0AAD2G9C5_9STRA|nr:unnamed protein product [Cylindrotheca closterium]
MGSSVAASLDDDIKDLDVASFIESLIQEEASIQLRPETTKFLLFAHKYIRCREKMDAKYLEVDEFKQIAQLENVDVKLEITDEHQQLATSGDRPVETLDELYEAAVVVGPVYQDYIRNLVDQVCEACGDSVETVDVQFASLKGKERALAKAFDDYSNRTLPPGISWLYDIVRGSIKFVSADQVLKCLEILQNDPSIAIISAKNRFKNPTLTGYRDLNVHFRMTTEGGVSHICEIQIHHKAIKALCTELDSHSLYEYFRKYFAGATGKLKERLGDLKLVGGSEIMNSENLQDLLDETNEEYRLNRLATLFREYLCEFGVAFRVYCRLLHLQLEQYGEVHITVASTYYRMGRVLAEQGRLSEALKLYKVALRMFKEIHGKDHPTVPATFNDIGCVLWLQGELESAMELFEEAAKMFKNCRGMEHPYIVIAYSNMAMIHSSQGNYGESMRLYQQSLDMKRKTYGEEHSEVATAYSKFAQAYFDMGGLDKAMQLYEISLDIYKKTLGERHADVATTLYGMACVWKQKENWDNAMKLFQQSLEIFQNTRGADHEYVAILYRNMAEVLREQNYADAAEELEEKRMAISQKMKRESKVIAAPEFIGR